MQSKTKESHLEFVNIGNIRTVTAGRRELLNAFVRDVEIFRGTGNARPRLVFDSNGHAISLNKTDKYFSSLLQAADIIHADGGFVVAASKLLTNTPIAERSATTDMIHDFALEAQGRSLKFYLLGGSEEVSSACVNELRRLYPQLNICGRRNGFFSLEEEESVVADINANRPDIVWVGLGKPKEQAFCVRHKDAIRAAWLITCGGCFNYITGHYRRAPSWMQKANLEWLHRMLTKPRQLFLRYLTTTPHALYLVLMQKKSSTH
jgi:exopolysaccharide biosynthesis WecB/TagA/CpsF family protein